ncbi:hypothetical protein TREMEDRAFT_42185 [Tremella mesenterica DSM 1558]|uniref:uncharacterized protein n=1 Tax=Tremella mesenterica (strain ATCC 24925 / CBS 8224 / DSM 1558 / NBRC 9311 / NRRL Y-6157 / RJB 2259-6 / UBC 559-6) TaxID=578456 RepID=UPI0003F48DBA|nr:uncharacterized protein TREMEDRAFT_42185 [Tremella mesenterica DSM 1558]EIW73109.1 hypothetical protein TREMEDRAFT_42185 [Tremella mesenterica DSM 1558]
MCIVFYTLSQPGYKLILASNRDEYLSRPALPAHWHNFPSLPISTNGRSKDVPPDIDPDSNDTYNHLNGLADSTRHEEEDEDEAWVLSGLDLGNTVGGTWLGMTKDLRIGVITNVRQPGLNPSPPSRGTLLKDFLSPSPHSAEKVHDYLKSHVDTVGEYEGFNLLLFRLHPPQTSNPTQTLQFASNTPILSNIPSSPAIPSVASLQLDVDISHSSEGEKEKERISLEDRWETPEIGYLSNRPKPIYVDLSLPSSPIIENTDKKIEIKTICHGLSNSPLKEPWPKVIFGEERMAQSLTQWEENEEDEDKLIERMFDILSDSKPINTLVDAKSSTTIPALKLGPNPLLPPKQGEGRWYGTRLSTVILVRDDATVVFVERDVSMLSEDGREAIKGKGERRFEFVAHSEATS